MTTSLNKQPGYTMNQGRAVLMLMICITVALDFARQPIYFLIDPVRATFGMSDVESSILLGAAFALPLTVMSLIGGWLSDRGSRRWLVGAAMVCWAAGAALFALSGAYAGLVAGRVLVGLGAGIVVPVAMTWISDAFTEDKRGKANGLYFIILSVGPAYSGAITGTIQKYAESGVGNYVGLLKDLEPWRLTLFVLAIPTLIFIPLVFFLKDLRQSAMSQSAGDPDSASDNTASTHSWNMAALMIFGIALMVMVDTANITWMPTVLKRKFGWDAQQVGYAFGAVATAAGVLGPLVGGWMGDKVYARHGVAGRLWLSAVSAGLCSLLLFAYFSDSQAVLIVALALNGVLTVAVLVMGYVGLQAILPSHRRGFGTGLMAAANSLVGAAGPTLVALVAERMDGSGAALGTATAVVCPALALVATGAMAASARAVGRGSRPLHHLNNRTAQHHN